MTWVANCTRFSVGEYSLGVATNREFTIHRDFPPERITTFVAF